MTRPTRRPPSPQPQLERYLSFFHGATTRVFNVGEYRRRSLGEHALGAASRTCSDGHFFDSLSPGMTSNGRAAFFDPLDSSASAARLGFATQASAFLFSRTETQPCCLRKH